MSKSFGGSMTSTCATGKLIGCALRYFSMSDLSVSSNASPIAATLSWCALTKAEMSGSSFRHGEHHVAQ